ASRAHPTATVLLSQGHGGLSGFDDVQRALVEELEHLTMRLAWTVRQLARRRPRCLRALAAPEERHRQRAGAGADAIGATGDVLVVRRVPGDHDDLGCEGGQHVTEARNAAHGENEDARARADREELERPERESVRVELVARGVADEHGAL